MKPKIFTEIVSLFYLDKNVNRSKQYLLDMFDLVWFGLELLDYHKFLKGKLSKLKDLFQYW